MSVTLLIIIVTCVVSIAAFRNQQLLERSLFWPYYVKRNNEWWRFITCGFIHADYMHLAFNMITLYFFGRIAETYIFPRLEFVLFYVLALVASNLYSYFRHKDNFDYRALGASGAVSAVVFAFIILAPWEKIIIFVIGVPAILYGVFYLGYSAYMSRKGYDNIGHDAHLWGGVFGIVYTLALRPELGRLFLEQLLHFRS
ncbi:rhomboid family intramembrane serine protease [Compostibacter hankyongensis]|uniref:Rhomboid family intramembrane serine protease n=1 Tax=Compostibacter hankyongensis TaxID=1007089 RepID=A0ABP8FMA4_9BACT